MNLMVRAETSTYSEFIHQKKSNLSNTQNETTSFSKEYSNLNLQGENISHHDWLLLCEERSTYEEKWIEFFSSYDFRPIPPYLFGNFPRLFWAIILAAYI